ncbi:MAG: DUF4097 family beta strand repeat-containing protein [Gemmatimonadales bacterium]
MTRLSLAGLLALAALPGGAAAQSFTVPGDAVAVYNLVGEATVTAASGGSVTVQVTPVGRDGNQIKPETADIRGRKALVIRYPDDDLVYRAMGRGSSSSFQIREDGTWGGGYSGDDDDDRGWRGHGHKVRVRGDGDGLEAAANLRIAVPAGKRVAVFVGVGRIDVTNVDGELLLDTSSGDVTTRGTKGTLRIDTGSGDVDVTGSSGSLLDIDTGSGTVEISEVTADELRVDTGSGDIIANSVSTGRIEFDTGSGEVKATLRSSPSHLAIDTGSGDVTLRLPEGVDATVDLDTGSGDFNVDFPMQLVHKDDGNLRGRLGKGTGRISVETGSGDISLLK